MVSLRHEDNSNLSVVAWQVKAEVQLQQSRKVDISKVETFMSIAGTWYSGRLGDRTVARLVEGAGSRPGAAISYSGNKNTNLHRLAFLEECS